MNLRRLSVGLGSAAVVVVASALALSFYSNQQVGPGPSPGATPAAQASPSATSSEEPSGDLGIFAPVAGQIVYCTNSGLWAVDPSVGPRPRCASRERPTLTANVHRSPG